MKSLILGVFLIALCFAFTNCEDEEPQTVMEFESTEKSVTESDGTQFLIFSLNPPPSSDIEVNYDLMGTAILNGDYELVSSNPLMVEAGSDRAQIEVNLIDDNIIEFLTLDGNQFVEADDKTLEAELTSVTGNAIVGESASTTLNIADNDDFSGEGMKVDLWWTVVGNDNMDAVNLNVYALYDVVLDENNAITSFEIYTEDTGENPSGFESFVVRPTAPDSDYYIAIEYTEGSGDADFTSYVYLTEGIAPLSDTFTEPSSDGVATVYGAFTKSGSTFGRIRGDRKLKVKSSLLRE